MRVPRGRLTEAEFLSAVLIANELVDSDTLHAIRRQFRTVVRRALPADGPEASSPESIVKMPPLDAKLVFEELTARGRVGAGVSYDTWYRDEWLPRVQREAAVPLGSPIEVPRVDYTVFSPTP